MRNIPITAAWSARTVGSVLQYWFFFCYNSWRSGFHGVNDHESDWEMVTLYLYENEGNLYPRVGSLCLA